MCACVYFFENLYGKTLSVPFHPLTKQKHSCSLVYDCYAPIIIGNHFRFICKTQISINAKLCFFIFYITISNLFRINVLNCGAIVKVSLPDWTIDIEDQNIKWAALCCFVRLNYIIKSTKYQEKERERKNESQVKAK